MTSRPVVPTSTPAPSTASAWTYVVLVWAVLVVLLVIGHYLDPIDRKSVV